MKQINLYINNEKLGKKDSITSINKRIKELAKENKLKYSKHALLRCKQRNISIDLLNKAIFENGAVVMIEKANGDHFSSSNRYTLLADVYGAPIIVFLTYSYNKCIVITAYAGNDYFLEIDEIYKNKSKNKKRRNMSKSNKKYKLKSNNIKKKLSLRKQESNIINALRRGNYENL